MYKYSLLNASASHLTVRMNTELPSYEIVCKLTAVILKTYAQSFYTFVILPICQGNFVRIVLGTCKIAVAW